MHTVTLLSALAATVSAQSLFAPGSSGLLRRQSDDEETYIASVCTPNITSPVPPCTEIISIEEQCKPNNTSPLGYLAHQQCICNGGFFANWDGCLNCQYVHGSRSEAVVDAFKDIIASASSQLCTGTPTASFAAIFSSLSEAAPQSASGAATSTSDQFPSQSAVSLYYTASGNQGAGVITGSAASATATGSTSAQASGSNVAASLVSSISSSGKVGSSSAVKTSSAGSSSASSATAAAASSTKTGAANKVNALGGLAVLAAGIYVL